MKTFNRHKLVNKIITSEISQIHGLTLKTYSTNEKEINEWQIKLFYYFVIFCIQIILLFL